MGSGMDILEMDFYKNILPTFVQFEEKLAGKSELRNLFPKFFYREKLISIKRMDYNRFRSNRILK